VCAKETFLSEYVCGVRFVCLCWRFQFSVHALAVLWTGTFCCLSLNFVAVVVNVESLGPVQVLMTGSAFHLLVVVVVVGVVVVLVVY
jgi:hypothetical protein